MSQQLIPKEIINEGIGELYYLLPIPFIALVIMASIWLSIIGWDGSRKKYYKLYNAIIAIAYAAVAYFFIEVDKTQVNNIPTLIISIVSSGFCIELVLYYRKRKHSKKG